MSVFARTIAYTSPEIRMKGKLITLVLVAALSGCQSLLIYENGRRGVQPDEVIINLSLWAAMAHATRVNLGYLE